MGLAALVSDALGVAPPKGRNPLPIDYSPQEQAADEAHDRTPGNVAELKGEIAKAKNPQIRAALEGELTKINGDNTSPFSGLSDTVSGALSGSVPGPKVEAPIVEAPKPQVRGGDQAGKFDVTKSPILETGTALVTGAGSMIAGGLHGLYKLATGEGPASAAEAVTSAQQAGTYQPQGAGGKGAIEALASPWNPLNWPSVISKKISEGATDKGVTGTGPAMAAAGLEAGAAMLAPGAFLKGAKAPTAAVRAVEAGEKSRFGSVGASAASRGATMEAELASASPELRQAATKLKPVEMNPEALSRHIEADSLPVPVKLTAGQATQDVGILSREQNRRGTDEALRNRFNEQNGQLVENVNAIREKAAPDVYGTNHVENGQALIDAYKATDDALTADITAKYKLLEEANGAQFPVDGQAFVRSAEEALGKKLKTEFLPSGIQKQMDKFKSGEHMTFEQFEAMRTNLAAEMRKAERSGDGNAAYAAGVVREALESLPMAGETAALKPIADAARSAAKARFDLLKKDPAYRAAVNDAVAADDFISKFVVRGKAGDVKTMVEHLGEGSVAHQTMSAGAINYLKSKAGIVNENGNFSQAGYNKALQELNPKLLDIVGPEAKKNLETLGNVARYTQAQPRGSFVNNSNTLVGAMAEGAKGFAEGAANKAIGLGVVPVGTMVRESAARRAAAKETQKSLQTGAGISLKDIGK